VSNFDLPDMVEAAALPGGDEIVTDQVLYNLKYRGIEWDLMPWCREHGIPIMACSPIEHSPGAEQGFLDHSVLQLIGARHHATPAQVVLAWLLQQGDIVAIPKATRPAHIWENRAALEVKLSDEDLIELDEAFPPPRRKVSLTIR
jgi:diketogulonate reductase-like aldo/keto reductase